MNHTATVQLTVFVLTMLFSAGALATGPLAPCGPKTKSKISQLEKQTAAFFTKVNAFRGKQKAALSREGRMPASYCNDNQNPAKKAALLAQEGVTYADGFEAIEKTVGGECTILAAQSRTKVETAYLDLNRSYIQSCPHEL